MKAVEWHYAGEGGKHALFSYRAEGELSVGDRKLVGRLLRLDKKYLRHSTDWSAAEGVKGPSVESPSSGGSYLFLRDFMKPQFGHYLDLPSQVQLSWFFVLELRAKVLETQPCPIPQARRKDWFSSNNNEKIVTQNASGWILRDYRTSIAQPNEKSPILSFEIKPKAGYLASSPLVDPKHAAKFYESRFVLLQKLDRMGYQDQVERGWKSNTETPTTTSSYDPLDLFSKDPTRNRRALEALWDCPQNNFKLWITPFDSEEACLVVADKHYQSDNNEGTGETLLEELLGDLSKLGSGQESKEACISLLVSILQAEHDFLDKLQQWQLLDVLDGDGAQLVYNRLVDLCDDDDDDDAHKEAQQLLDQYSTHNQDPSPESAGITGSPLPPPPSLALLEELQRFSRSLQCLREQHDNPREEVDAFLQQEHETSRRLCLNQVAQIQSKEACIYLLQNWLLSLAVCDVSFFVTLQSEEKKVIEEPSINCDTTCAKAQTRILEAMKDGQPGRIQLKDTTGQSILYRYTIQLIDCDPKPAKKLRSRYQKEQVFDYL